MHLLNATLTFFLCMFTACADPAPNPSSFQDPKVHQPAVTGKPPSSYPDTLFVEEKAAVFYEPDSLQLEKIRQLTDPRIFESSTHEYEYQFKNARKVLKRDWSAVPVKEAKNVRYIVFQGKKGTHIIDLDNYNDAYGLFVFNGLKAPRQVEMTNAETLIPDYFERD